VFPDTMVPIRLREPIGMSGWNILPVAKCIDLVPAWILLPDRCYVSTAVRVCICVPIRKDK
jgi:hypothetical protein